MKVISHIIGMPNIGIKRELKIFAEKFFNNKNSKNKNFFNKCIKKININNIYYQRKLDYLTIGNLKLFDPVLHTMCCLSIIPKRFRYFKKIDIKEIEIFMKGEKGKKPLKMLKFFNNNFHYFVPEIDENFSNKKRIKYKYKFLDKIKNKKKLKYSILGINTFIKLCDFRIKKKNSIKNIIKIYYKYIKNIYKKYKLKYIQLEEYILNFSKKIIKFYKKLFKKKIKIFLVILKKKIIYKNIKKILKFVSVVHIDVYEQFDIKLIKKISKKKKISLGIINGYNIWVNNYLKSIKKICYLKKNLFISTNCSLIHVPFTTKREIGMPKYISFALEKIKEILEIKKIFLNFKKNYKIFLFNFLINKKLNKNKFNFNRIKFIKNKRKRVTKEEIGIKKISDTTIGSFPQTKNLRKIRKNYENKKINFKIYKKKILNYIKKNIKIQKKYKVKIFVNGEPERSDMVEFFCKNYKGFYITKNGWVQSYSTRCVKPPILYKKPIRIKSSVKNWYKNIKNLKGIVTGPNTISKWSFIRENVNYKNIIYCLSDIVSKEIKDLFDIGIKIIQIDEPALIEILYNKKNKKKYYEIFINSFNNSCKYIYNKKVQIHSHICYSNIKKKDLKIFKKMYIDVLSIESSKKFYETINFIKKNKVTKYFEVGPGLYDVHSKNKPNYYDIKKKVLYMFRKLGIKNVWLNPDCGLKTRKYSEVKKYLKLIRKIKKKYNTSDL
ncbi:5-methyltetrahydropteroyltriglutamate--homocysteine S-methyltransferase [Candidatus Vidania fulgoroideorum]